MKTTKNTSITRPVEAVHRQNNMKFMSEKSDPGQGKKSYIKNNTSETHDSRYIFGKGVGVPRAPASFSSASQIGLQDPRYAMGNVQRGEFEVDRKRSFSLRQPFVFLESDLKSDVSKAVNSVSGCFFIDQKSRGNSQRLESFDNYLVRIQVSRTTGPYSVGRLSDLEAGRFKYYLVNLLALNGKKTPDNEDAQRTRYAVASSMFKYGILVKQDSHVADCLQRLIPSSLKESNRTHAIMAAVESELFDIACEISKEPFDITEENMNRYDVLDLCIIKKNLDLVVEVAKNWPSAALLERLGSAIVLREESIKESDPAFQGQLWSVLERLERKYGGIGVVSLDSPIYRAQLMREEWIAQLNHSGR